MAAEAAWPEALAELVGTECFAECLAALEIASLADLAETVDLEEGHDATMRAAVAKLPDKPKKARIKKARCARVLDELLDAYGSKALPPLLKGYLRLGGFVGDGAVVDEDFGTTDVCLILKTDWASDRYRKHYTREDNARGGSGDG